MRPKSKNSRIKSFSLTEEEIFLIEQLTEAGEHSSQSEFVGWLIRNYDIIKDPIKELGQTMQEKVVLQKKLKDLEEQENQILERIKAHKKRQEERDKAEKEAIQILQSHIVLGKTKQEIWSFARYWAFRLNKDADELIYKAGIKLKMEAKT